MVSCLFSSSRPITNNTMDIWNTSPGTITDLGPLRSTVNRGATNVVWWSQNNTPTPSQLLHKQHNCTIKALLPVPHCLISAAYLWYLYSCSYFWPSACCCPSTPLPHPQNSVKEKWNSGITWNYYLGFHREVSIKWFIIFMIYYNFSVVKKPGPV